MAAGGNTANIALGPGRLYYAPLGTAEPTNCSTALPVAWKVVGYTEEGTTVETEISSEGIEVAEEMDPVLWVQTKRMTRVNVSMAEVAISRLALAMGAGATRADDATFFEFPTPANFVGVMLVWDSLDVPDATNRRWIFRSVFPNGNISIARKKAPNNTFIPVTFNAVLPTGQASPVRVYPNASGQF